MSRIGRKPIEIPAKVQVTVNGAEVSVKGPNGQLNYKFADGVLVELGSGIASVKVTDLSLSNLWGMSRTLLSNMVTGVTVGFTKELEFNGVGYKAAVKGDVLTLNLGYSHPIDYKLPKGISAKVTGNKIEVLGIDKELVGFSAAKIRSFRPPEPYKGKGIKYSSETIIRKAGKAGGKGK